MDASVQRKLINAAQLLGPLSRSAAMVFFAGVIILAEMQDTARHTSVFQTLQVLVFSALAFILVCGLAVLAIGLSTKCPSCGRRATFVGPRNSAHPYPLSTGERFVSFFWPTAAYRAASRCSNCGQPFTDASNAQSPNS